MKFEDSELQSLADALAQRLNPLVEVKSQDTMDVVFDKKGLADYLNVDVSWIDKQVSARNIPFLKLGKYVRFKKSHIDKWLDTIEKQPSPHLKMLKTRRRTS